ncbi:MAG TPA: TolC family protein, partial [Geobacteraceae bacterium]|nr:TolC family protein [Geobacteraceae bacterium]
MRRVNAPFRLPRTIRQAVFFCGILTGFFVSSASCAEIGTTPPSPSAPITDTRLANLTLRDCLDIALTNNHSRAVSRFGIEIAEAQHRQATSAYWPQLGVKASATIMDEDPNFIFPAKTMRTPASTVIATTPLGPMPIEVPAGSYEIPEQNVKLMDRKNLYATLNATLPLYTGGRISAVVRQAEQGMRAAREEA